MLLGCTHYPYLARTLADVMGRDVVLVSSADETAFEVRRRLEALGLSRPVVAGAEAVPAPAPTFLTTGDVEWFTDLGGRLLGPELAGATLVCWD
jgi:glutamate racemase